MCFSRKRNKKCHGVQQSSKAQQCQETDCLFLKEHWWLLETQLNKRCLIFKRECYTLLVGMQLSAFTVENELRVHGEKAKCIMTIWSNYLTPAFVAKGNEVSVQKRYPFVAMLLTTAKIGNQPRCLSTNECIKKICYMNTVIATILLPWRDAMMKATLKRKRLGGGLLIVSEGEFILSWWGAWQQTGRHGIEAVADRLHLLGKL